MPHVLHKCSRNSPRFCYESWLLTGEISQQELLRAQTQLKSMLLMNLEIRPVIFEDCAIQVLSMGHRRKPEHFISLIDKVTIDDINRIGQKMLDSKAAVAAIGTLKKLPHTVTLKLVCLI